MRTLSSREARLVAVLILIMVLVLADLAVVKPLISGFTDRAQARVRLTARYESNARLIATVPRLVMETKHRDIVLAHYVLSVPDAGAATDALRQNIQSATSAVGGDFRGSEDVPSTLGVTATRASLRMSGAQLYQLLAKLENGQPLITVTALSVSADDALEFGPAATLDVQIECTIAYRVHYAS